MQSVTGGLFGAEPSPVRLEGRGARVMDEAEVRRRIELLRIEHRDLDAAGEALLAGTSPDQLQIARMKKRKLRLKDEVAQLENLLVPDIIA